MTEEGIADFVGSLKAADRSAAFSYFQSRKA